MLITILGLLLTAGAAGARFYFKDSMLAAVALVILEPAGWFSIWNGLDLVFQGGKSQKEEYKFYCKMSSAEIIFNGY